MPNPSYPAYTPSHGYMTEKIQQKYIAAAIKDKKLPENAHRMPEILTLNASVNPSKPLQFWQLYSVLSEKRIVRIVQNFYQRSIETTLGFGLFLLRLAIRPITCEPNLQCGWM